MGLKRITARIEVTYPADDPRTLEELRNATPGIVATALGFYDNTVVLASYGHLNAAVDPDPEPVLPDEPDPAEQTG